MRVVFVEFNGEVTAECVGDNVGIGLANMVWQADARRGEVVAEMSQQTDEMTAAQKKSYEEVFKLGRIFQHKLMPHRVDDRGYA